MDMNNVVIPESTPVGTVIYRLEGSDPEDSPVTYNIHGTDVLQVNHTSGEKNQTLNVNISIEDQVDNGGKNNVVEVPITVIISDENDNEPQFQNAPYDFAVPEDTEPGATVFSGISVTDVDTTGSNIEVECFVYPEDPFACDNFKIEPLLSESNTYNGVIKLKRKLSYAEKQKYRFGLRATDGELTSMAEASVTVGDVQDTPPYFVGGLEAEVSEDAPIGTLVMTVHAEDGDRDPKDYFLLDAMTGELRTAKPLDKEALDDPKGIIKIHIKVICSFERF
nr:unnamed protein product [Callosobruchus analis]